MLTRLIPRTTERLPVIGCGTYRAFDTRDPARAAELGRVVDTLIEAGGRLVDSSPMYGQAEDVAGALLAERDNAGFVATKVWIDGKADGIRQMERSFAYFRRDCIDLMQVHNLVDVDVHLPTLLDWKAKGRIRYVGVTHYANSAHRAVAQAMHDLPLDFIQINYSLDNRAVERRLLPLARELGIGVIVNYPFGGGKLVRRLARRPLPDFAKGLGLNSWAAILLNFIVAHEGVTCAIPGTGNPAHMADNIQGGADVLADVRADILKWWAQAAL